MGKIYPRSIPRDQFLAASEAVILARTAVFPSTIEFTGKSFRSELPGARTRPAGYPQPGTAPTPGMQVLVPAVPGTVGPGRPQFISIYLSIYLSIYIYIQPSPSTGAPKFLGYPNWGRAPVPCVPPSLRTHATLLQMCLSTCFSTSSPNFTIFLIVIR
eukprot:Gb_19973 [translate_table: standard]